ncbi:MAG: hypothetical protein AB7K37_04980 [Cyclobacteriaceae bacterium]
MKKSVVLVIVAVSLLAASCSQYTCPTYAKSAPKKDLKESRI